MSGENFENESTIFCDPKIQKNNPASSAECCRVRGFDDQTIFDDDRFVSDLTVSEFKKILRSYMLRFGG